MAADEGAPFVKSKEGVIRFLILILLFAAFILIAVAGYSGVIVWVLTAYIISWVLSLHTYFFIATGVASHMKCGVPFDDVDIILSVFSFFNCTLASVTLSIYARATSLWIAATVLGFAASILYAVELCLLRENPPLNLKYLIGRNGLVKASICIVGCTAFVLLYASGFRCFTSTACDAARIWVLVAYIYSWGISTILLILRLVNTAPRLGYFELFDMFWSFFSFISCLVASIVLVIYLDCTSFTDFTCGTRLAAVILGFYVSVLFLVDLVLLKRKFGRVLDRNVFAPKEPDRPVPVPVQKSKSTKSIKI